MFSLVLLTWLFEIPSLVWFFLLVLLADWLGGWVVVPCFALAGIANWANQRQIREIEEAGLLDSPGRA